MPKTISQIGTGNALTQTTSDVSTPSDCGLDCENGECKQNWDGSTFCDCDSGFTYDESSKTCLSDDQLGDQNVFSNFFSNIDSVSDIFDSINETVSDLFFRH